MQPSIPQVIVVVVNGNCRHSKWVRVLKECYTSKFERPRRRREQGPVFGWPKFELYTLKQRNQEGQDLRCDICDTEFLFVLTFCLWQAALALSYALRTAGMVIKALMFVSAKVSFEMQAMFLICHHSLMRLAVAVDTIITIQSDPWHYNERMILLVNGLNALSILSTDRFQKRRNCTLVNDITYTYQYFTHSNITLRAIHPTTNSWCMNGLGKSESKSLVLFLFWFVYSPR